MSDKKRYCSFYSNTVCCFSSTKRDVHSILHGPIFCRYAVPIYRCCFIPTFNSDDYNDNVSSYKRITRKEMNG